MTPDRIPLALHATASAALLYQGLWCAACSGLQVNDPLPGGHSAMVGAVAHGAAAALAAHPATATLRRWTSALLAGTAVVYAWIMWSSTALCLPCLLIQMLSWIAAGNDARSGRWRIALAGSVLAAIAWTGLATIASPPPLPSAPQSTADRPESSLPEPSASPPAAATLDQPDAHWGSPDAPWLLEWHLSPGCSNCLGLESLLPLLGQRVAAGQLRIRLLLSGTGSKATSVIAAVHAAEWVAEPAPLAVYATLNQQFAAITGMSDLLARLPAQVPSGALTQAWTRNQGQLDAAFRASLQRLVELRAGATPQWWLTHADGTRTTGSDHAALRAQILSLP
ncbi:MAG TPA: hypothetical protein DCS97_10540 [Planctomycetes bacterium]|nr:hypothetical protein [Planctomycetota bacterium]